MPTNSRPTSRPRYPEEISTLEFYRRLFADELDETPARPVLPRNDDREMSLEQFYRELFAEPARPLVLGPRPGLAPPALPAQFRRVRGGNALVSYELLVDEHGRIAAKHENLAGCETYFLYEYDRTGHLLRVWRNGRLAEEYAYDGRGARVASWNARDGQWACAYDQRGRLAAAGPWKFSYAEDGSLREAWTPKLSYHFAANQAEGLTRIVLPGGRVLRSETLAPGLPVEKYIDAVPVESLSWRSPLQLATYRDRKRGVQMQFHYAGSERLPQAVTVQDGSGSTSYLLGYDQVGSLKAAAAMDGPHEGQVAKVMDYDAFGNVLSDSNPALSLPLGFAGGLRDRFTGLVRFLHRDYDPTVGRFTAPDPLGDTGGDHDVYDYCVDEPVGRVDPEGLEEKGFWSGIWDSVASRWDSITSQFKSDTPQAPETEAQALKKMDTASRDVDSTLKKAGNVINSVRPEVEDIAKGAGIAGKITLPQEAHEAATKLEKEVSAEQKQREALLNQFKSGRTTHDQADAALALAEHYQNATRPMILGKPGEVLHKFNDWFNPLPTFFKKE